MSHSYSFKFKQICTYMVILSPLDSKSPIHQNNIIKKLIFITIKDFTIEVSCFILVGVIARTKTPVGHV